MTDTTTPVRSKSASLAIVTGLYVVAVAAAAAWLYLGPDTAYLWLDALIADLVATAVVFAGSRIVHNSSCYDAYWSVIPPLLAVYWWLEREPGADEVLVGKIGDVHPRADDIGGRPAQILDRGDGDGETPRRLCARIARRGAAVGLDRPGARDEDAIIDPERAAESELRLVGRGGLRAAAFLSSSPDHPQ